MRSNSAVDRKRPAFGAVLLVCGVLLLSGCSTPTPPDPGESPIDAARALKDAPEPVRTGDATDTCGDFVLDQGETVPADAIACLDAAKQDDRSAELAWSSLTIEGDPIVRFAFADSFNEGIVVFTTNAFDSYGGDPTWSNQSCPDTATATGYGGGCVDPVEG